MMCRIVVATVIPFGILKEKFYDGCTGQITFNTGTCFQSPIVTNPCGSTAGNTGPSSTSPCRTDVNPVATGGFSRMDRTTAAGVATSARR